MSTRQEKVSKQIQKDIAQILQTKFQGIVPGTMVTVTEAQITPDFGFVKIYISIFPSKDKNAAVDMVNKKQKEIRFELGKKVKNQLRKVPEIRFYLDDSLDQMEKIDKLLNSEQ